MSSPQPPRARVLRTLCAAVPALALVVGALIGCSAGTFPEPGSSSTSTITRRGPDPRTAPAAPAQPTEHPAEDPSAAAAATPHQSVAASPAPTSSNGSHLDVTVTFSGWNGTTRTVEVGGYVAGVIDSDAICTLTLTNGATTVRQAVAGVADVSSTSCGTVSVGRAQLRTGTWTAHLAYASRSGSGTSPDVSIEVP